MTANYCKILYLVAKIVKYSVKKIYNHSRTDETINIKIMLKFSKIKKFISKYQDSSLIYSSESLTSAEPSQARVQDLVKIFNSKNFKEVLIKVNKLIRSFPQSAVLFNIQGAANAALHKHDAAVASYKKSLILNSILDFII